MQRPNVRRSNSSRANKLRAALAEAQAPCWICREFGRPGGIDYGLPHGHPLAFELDHLVPISRGGDPYDPRNCAAAHRKCNRWRSDMSVEEVRRAAAAARQHNGPCSIEYTDKVHKPKGNTSGAHSEPWGPL